MHNIFKKLIQLINLYENRTEILGLNIFQANLNNKSLDQIDCMNEEELFEEIKYIKEKIAIQADNYGYESDDDDMLIKRVHVQGMMTTCL